MKRLISFLLTLLVLFCLFGCQGNFGSVDLQDTVEIPADGIVPESTLRKLMEEHEIATFYGESNGYKYEWIIFGSDIAEPGDVNLLLDIQKASEEGLSVSGAQEGAFGFPALLSIHTGEKWDAFSATAYRQAQAMSSVSLTGSQETILNLSLTEGIRNWVIRPDKKLSASLSPETTATPGTDETKPTTENAEQNQYLSQAQIGDNRVYSDGKGSGQDKYLTDPIPEGKPMPVEPEDQDINQDKSYTCTFSIECSTILNNLSDLDPEKLEMVPSDGVILATTTVTFYEGESVYDVLQRLCQEKGIHMEASWTPIYNSAYVEGIHNLYEFDCGNESGWMYRVNGWYPNYGCSRYQLAQGDVVEWRYTCKGLGKDIGCPWMG